jgi:hypothetical protein
VITHQHEDEAAPKKFAVQITYFAMAPAAVSKLEKKQGDLAKLTKREILSIIVCVFHTLKEEKRKKEMLVEVLRTLAGKDPAKLSCLDVAPAVVTVHQAPPHLAASQAALSSARAEIAEAPAVHVLTSTVMHPSSV